MDKEQLALIVQELAQKYGIEIDNTPDEFGRFHSERIAGFVTSIYNGWNSVDYAELSSKMAYIDSIIGGETISIVFTAKQARSEDNTAIPSDCIGKDARIAIADSIYHNIHQDLLCFIADAELFDYMKQGVKLYTDARLWEKAKRKVNDRISNERIMRKNLSKRQHLAVLFIYDLIPHAHKTDELAFIYDVLKEGNLITSQGKRDKQAKYQYLKQYLKKHLNKDVVDT